MKKTVARIVAALFCAVMLSACSSDTSQSANTTEVTPPPQQTPAPAPTEAPADPYSDIIRQYIVHDGAGTCTMDLDGDGTEELFIGPTAGDIYERQQVTAMYAKNNGTVRELFVSSDKDQYYLSENGTIVEENILSTYDKCYRYYAYSNGELKLMMTVGFDVAADKDNPWYKIENDEKMTVSELDAIGFLQAYQNSYRSLPYV